MPNQITLDDVKEYLRISNSDEDNLLVKIKDAVIMFIKNYLGKHNFAIISENFPADLKISALDHIAFLYDNRGSNAQIPSRIFASYKKYKTFKLF